MYAVIKTGGKQYKVASNDVIKVEKLIAEVGSEVVFDEVLLAGDKIGEPLVKGAKVTAEVLEQNRADKILVFKKRRRKGYRRTQGHRQHQTVVRIKNIATA
ncbi:MAG: 50S ribosomal protein L21 [Alphaproteobacteria bacterium]